MRELITVDMSEMQFAQFITSMNTHSGASCTLGRVGGRRREAPPRDMLGKETFQGDVEARAKKVGAGLLGAIGLVEGLAERGRAGKGDLTEVANALRAAAMEIESNMPHLMERMAENVERLLETARADLNAHAHLLRQGLLPPGEGEGWRPRASPAGEGAALRGAGSPPPARTHQPASSSTRTPRASALASLDPASGPATRMSVLFDTLPEVLAPSERACSSAASRGMRSSVPVGTPGGDHPRHSPPK